MTIEQAIPVINKRVDELANKVPKDWDKMTDAALTRYEGTRLKLKDAWDLVLFHLANEAD